jgi:hypothetical protein
VKATGCLGEDVSKLQEDSAQQDSADGPALQLREDRHIVGMMVAV